MPLPPLSVGNAAFQRALAKPVQRSGCGPDCGCDGCSSPRADDERSPITPSPVQRSASSPLRIDRAKEVIGETTVDRPTTTYSVTRTRDAEPCEKVPKRIVLEGAKSPFYIDQKTTRLGIHYKVCEGGVEKGADAHIDYRTLATQAGQLASQLPTTLSTNPTAAMQQIAQAFDAVKLETNASIEYTVSERFHAELKNVTENKKYELTGKMTYARGGWIVDGTITHEGQVVNSADVFNKRNTRFDMTIAKGRFSLKGQGGIDDKGDFSDTETAVVQLTPTLGVGLKGSIGDKSISIVVTGSQSTTAPKKVECCDWNCPTPKIDHTCIAKKKPDATNPDTPAPPARSKFQYDFQWDKTVPTSQARFDEEVEAAALQIVKGRPTKSIVGHASPEGSVAYNLDLSMRRGQTVSAALKKELTRHLSMKPGKIGDATLGGAGELMGEPTLPSAVAEVPNEGLIKSMTAHLLSLSDDDLVKALRPLQTPTPELVKDLRARLERFSKGTSLTTRQRWEQLFPFLRRVEVELGDAPNRFRADKQPVKDPAVECDAAVLAEAQAKLGAPKPELLKPDEKPPTCP